MSAVVPGPCPVCQVHAESVFKIDGMDCHEEVAILERRLKNRLPFFSLNLTAIDGQRDGVHKPLTISSRNRL